jgi:hypothetical protein
MLVYSGMVDLKIFPGLVRFIPTTGDASRCKGACMRLYGNTHKTIVRVQTLQKEQVIVWIDGPYPTWVGHLTEKECSRNIGVKNEFNLQIRAFWTRESQPSRYLEVVGIRARNRPAGQVPRH